MNQGDTAKAGPKRARVVIEPASTLKAWIMVWASFESWQLPGQLDLCHRSLLSSEPGQLFGLSSCALKESGKLPWQDHP